MVKLTIKSWSYVVLLTRLILYSCIIYATQHTLTTEKNYLLLAILITCFAYVEYNLLIIYKEMRANITALNTVIRYSKDSKLKKEAEDYFKKRKPFSLHIYHTKMRKK